MAPKRKATAIKAESTPAAASGLAGSDDDVKPKKRSPAKKPAITEPKQVENGWTLHPPSLIYKSDPKAQGGKKIAAFDLDGTLVHVKSRSRFAVDADDWKWFNKHTAQEVRKLYHDEGYQIVIFSNQGGIKSALDGAGSKKTRARADNVVAALADKQGSVPVQVFLATQSDEFRKPGAGMWDFFVENCNAGVKPDLASSFYVGDMAGRVGDVQGGGDGAPSDTDKGFAAATGIGFKTPEEAFGEGEAKKELVFQGSAGKNTGLAEAFQVLTDHYRKLGDGFKATAFAKVQKIIDGYPTPITSSKDLKGVAGVGKGSAAKIDEWLQTGKFAVLEEEGEGGAGMPKQDASAKAAAAFLNL